MAYVREIRILIQHRGVLRRLFKIAFSQKDASLYFFPYGPKGRYFYGLRSLHKYEIKHTFNYKEQLYSDKIPKLSIHQSGQVHIRYLGNEISVQLNTIALQEWRGEHIATVSADLFESLSEHKKVIKTTGSEIDHIIPCDNEVDSGRICVYANAQSPRFIYHCRVTVPILSSSLHKPIYIGLAPVSQQPLNRAGVTIITGWDPRKGDSERQDFLYIRAE